MAGRALLNFGDSSSYIYKNYAKNSVSFAGANSELWPGYLDRNGYPTQNPTNNIAFSVTVPPSYSGRWVVSFEGAGDLLIIAGSTTISDQDSCVVAAGGNTRIRSNTASESRGITRVVLQFATQPSSFSFNYPGGATKFSNGGGAAPDQLSSMQNLVFCRCSAPYGDGGVTVTGDEADIASGDLSRMFNQDTLDILTELSPSCLRFMGLTATNFSNVVSHATRHPVDAVTYMSRRWDPNLWAGAASGTNGIYSCSAAPGTPVGFTNGEQVQVQFTNAQQAAKPIISAILTGGTSISFEVADTSNLTTGQRAFIRAPGFTDTSASSASLNRVYTITVNDATHISITGAFSGTYTSGGNIGLQPHIDVGGRGSKQILTSQGVAPNSFFANVVISALQFSTLTWNTLLDAWIVGNFSTAAGGLGGDQPLGPPIEVLVALCNKLDMDLWFCIPQQMLTSEAVELAEFIRDNLASGRKAYFEYSNENWNPSFTQYHLMSRQGEAYGWPVSSGRNIFGFWALRYAEIMSAIGDIWAGGVVLQRVLAWQGASGSVTHTYLMTGSDLNSGSATYWSLNPVDYSVPGNRPLDHCEVFSYGMYYYGNQAFQFDAEYTANTTPARNAAYYAPLLAAADAFDAGDATAIEFIDNDVRFGTPPTQVCTIAADGTISVSSGTCVSNGVFGDRPIRLFVDGGSLPSPLVAETLLYYPVSIGSTSFKVALSQNGTAISSLTGGSGAFSFAQTGQSLLYWSTDRLNFWNGYAVTYGKPVVIYEAATSPWFPAVASCTTLGINTAYSQKILNLVVAWQKSHLSAITSFKQMDDFFSASMSEMPGQLQLVGLNPWSMLQGFIPPTSGTSSSFLGDILCDKNGTYDAFRMLNTNKRMMLLKS